MLSKIKLDKKILKSNYKITVYVELMSSNKYLVGTVLCI